MYDLDKSTTNWRRSTNQCHHPCTIQTSPLQTGDAKQNNATIHARFRQVHNKLETLNKIMPPSMYDLDKSTTNWRRPTKQCHHPCTIQTIPQQTGDAQQNNATIHVRSRQVHNKLETLNRTMPPSMYHLDKSATNWIPSTKHCHHPCMIQTSPQQTGDAKQNNATIHVRMRQVYNKLETLNKTMPQSMYDLDKSTSNWRRPTKQSHHPCAIKTSPQQTGDAQQNNATIHVRSRQVHNKRETLNKTMPPSMYDLDKSTTNWRRSTEQCHHPCTIQTSPQQTGYPQQNNATIHVRLRQVHNKLETLNKTMPPSMYDLDKSTTNWRRSTKQCHHPCTIQTSPQQTGDAQQNNATIHVRSGQVHNKLETLNKTMPPSMYDLDKSTTNWRRPTKQCHYPCTIWTSSQQTGDAQQNNTTIHVRFRRVHNKLETLNKTMPPSMYDLDKSTTNWTRSTKQCHHPCTIQTSPQQTGDDQQNNVTIHVRFRQVHHKLETLNKTMPPSIYDLDKSTSNWRRPTTQGHHPCTIQTSPQQTGDAQQTNATIHVRFRQVHSKLETLNKTMQPSMHDFDKSTTNWRR